MLIYNIADATFCLKPCSMLAERCCFVALTLPTNVAGYVKWLYDIIVNEMHPNVLVSFHSIVCAVFTNCT